MCHNIFSICSKNNSYCNKSRIITITTTTTNNNDDNNIHWFLVRKEINVMPKPVTWKKILCIPRRCILNILSWKTSDIFFFHRFWRTCGKNRISQGIIYTRKVKKPKNQKQNKTKNKTKKKVKEKNRISSKQECDRDINRTYSCRSGSWRFHCMIIYILI